MNSTESNDAVAATPSVRVRGRLTCRIANMLAIILMMLSASSRADAQAIRDAGPRLIVRGDDMGFSHAGNEAIVQCFREGIETTVEVIVPAPWFPEAVELLEKHESIDVGIHLTLTSEWEGVKWRPVSSAPSLQDLNGYFFPMVFPNPLFPQQALQDKKWKLADVEREFRAQIELAKRLIPRVSHCSGHMGCDHLSDEVRALARRLAKEYRIDIVPEELQVQNVTYRGAHHTAEEKLASFLQMLDALEAGKTYLFVDHPGLNVPELRAIQHRGYEDVAADRQ